MTDTLTVDCLSLVLTAQCNCRCTYCYQNAKQDRSMDWKVLRTSIDFALRSARRETNLVFLGGEPMLEFSSIGRAVEYVERTRPTDKQVGYIISTNGLLIDEGAAAFFAGHDFDVHLSFDGVEPAQQCRARGTFPVLDRLLSNLQLWQPGLFARKLRVCVTVVPASVPHFADSIRYLIGKGVRNISISPSLIHHPEWATDRIEELDSQFAAICEESEQQVRESGEIPLLYLRPGKNGARPANRNMCGLAWGTRLAVDVDGQVYACAALAESYQEFASELLESSLVPLRMGDIRDPRFRKRYTAFLETAGRTDMLTHKEKKYSSYGRCSECEFVGQCSVCPVSIGYDPGNADPNRVPDFVCAFNKAALKYRDRFSRMLDRLVKLETLIEVLDIHEEVRGGDT